MALAGKKIVIDANVGRSAGTAEAKVSSYSRKLLLAILKRGHLMVMSPSTAAEWDSHQSGFSRTWRTNMQQRGRIFRVNDSSFQALARKIQAASMTPTEVQALLKDAHIVGSALCTSKIIISNDFELVVNVQRFAAFHEAVLKLMWGDTLKEGEACIAWIEAGAKPVPERYTSRRSVPKDLEA